jgi:hypothetical protein
MDSFNNGQADNSPKSRKNMNSESGMNRSAKGFPGNSDINQIPMNVDSSRA